jgi:tRNA-dihydrouridine synthase A
METAYSDHQNRPRIIRPISVAPMMDRTDRHYRYMLRLISTHTLLYTEMVTTGAILFGDKPRHLDFSEMEGPLALQLGGDDPIALSECAQIAEEWGYDEVNLNVGCPSDRVQSGRFGACLMLRPEKVAEAVSAMKRVTRLPVTVKHRIGVDDVDRYEDMLRFVDIVSESGCDGFSVHARKAWLSGLSPKENRKIPPLRYEEVYRLKQERPHLFVEINGGVLDWEDINLHLKYVDAVMIGRGAYNKPRLFFEADRRLFPELVPAHLSLEEVILEMAKYTDRWVEQGGRAHHVTRHLVHLLSGIPGNKYWRRTLSEGAVMPGANGDIVRRAWAGAIELRQKVEQRI